MIKAFKFFVAVGMFVAFAGCSFRNSAKVAATVDKDFLNVYDAFEMAKNPRAKVTRVIQFPCPKACGLATSRCWWNTKIICPNNMKQILELRFCCMNL